jgi:hypothetical protein
MKIYKDEHDECWYLDFKLPGKDRPSSLAHFINDWRQLFRRGEYNWRTFNLIKVYVEDDTMLGGLEIEVALLGLGVRVRFGLKETERMNELRERMKDILPQPPQECDCLDCAVCGFPHMICAKCMICIMCHAHKEGCPGCPAGDTPASLRD